MATAQTHRELYTDVPAVTTADNVNVYPTGVAAGRFQRISWGAIFAGIVVALVTMLAFNMLGLSIGAATINPATEANPVEPAVATGSIIWLIASNLISLFLGGYVAAYMSRTADHTDGILHGIVTWGVVTLITFALLTTSIGNVVNGVVSAASQAIGTAGGIVAENSPVVAKALDTQNSVLTGIGTDVRMLMQANASAPSLSTGSTGSNQTATTDTTPTLDEIEINRAVATLFNQATITDADRQEVATLIAERTGITPAEATDRLARWEQLYIQVKTEAEDAVRSASQKVADAVTLLAGAMFAAFIAGAFAAGVGGLVAASEPATRVVVTKA
ncbi:MAG TPA: hypothetical protein VHL11_23270 [Phototrophicaceae bacterium]|nr:hypothetical protein [Phototrophicaceae bacterium]